MAEIKKWCQDIIWKLNQRNKVTLSVEHCWYKVKDHSIFASIPILSRKCEFTVTCITKLSLHFNFVDDMTWHLP